MGAVFSLVSDFVQWHFERSGMAAAIFCSLWLFLLCYCLFEFLMKKPWGSRAICRDRIREKQTIRRQKLREAYEKSLSLTEGERNRILSLSFDELRAELQDDKLAPVDVCKAYTYQMIRTNNRFNFIAEAIPFSFDVAEELQKKHHGQKEKPALYGMPFSVKGNFYMPGFDCTIGFAKYSGMPKGESERCSLVTTLLDLGAVPMCMTNVPQGLLSYVCSNPIHGTTENPRRIGKVPGGSSGGEAAIVTCRSVAFGTGSDLAGSLRIPALMCGIVSLKPSEARLKETNSHGGMPGKCRLGLSFGFFTRSVKEQITLYEVTLNSSAHKRHSNRSIPLPFDMGRINSEKKLRIGFYDFNGFLEPVPSNRRAVNDVVEMLKHNGHDLVRFEIPDPQLMAELVLKNIMPDGGAYMKELFANEIIDSYMTSFINLLRIPSFIRTLGGIFLQSYSPQLALMCRTGMSSISDLRYMQEQTDTYTDKFFDRWSAFNLDAVICPAFPVPSVDHQFPAHLGLCAVETALYNMLDCPAGVVPVTSVTEKDIANLMDASQFPVGWNPILKKMREAAGSSKGMPVSVQVVTLPHHEELCLHVMQVVEEAMKYFNDQVEECPDLKSISDVLPN